MLEVLLLFWYFVQGVSLRNPASLLICPNAVRRQRRDLAVLAVNKLMYQAFRSFFSWPTRLVTQN